MTELVWIYAIKTKDGKRIYVGISKDLNRRVKEHNRGTNRSTKFYRPWKLFYSEVALGWKEARKREKFLKSGSGKEFLKKLSY